MASSKKRRAGGLVWDSDIGSVCPRCRNAATRCSCRPANSSERGDGIVRVSLDRKGRRGKTVTVIHGLPGTALELGILAKELKQRCGSGGKVAEGSIEIQGDHRDTVLADLKERGFQVKRAGG